MFALPKLNRRLAMPGLLIAALASTVVTAGPASAAFGDATGVGLVTPSGVIAGPPVCARVDAGGFDLIKEDTGTWRSPANNWVGTATVAITNTEDFSTNPPGTYSNTTCTPPVGGEVDVEATLTLNAVSDDGAVANNVTCDGTGTFSRLGLIADFELTLNCPAFPSETSGFSMIVTQSGVIGCPPFVGWPVVPSFPCTYEGTYTQVV